MISRDSITTAINACLAGDPESFRLIVESYQNRLIRLAYRYVHDWEEAKDVSQEVFIKVYYSLKSVDPKKSFEAWILRITVNLCLDRLRQRQIRYRHAPLVEKLYTPSFEQPDAALQGREELLALHRSLEALNDRQRTVFILRELEDLSFAEIAQVLRCRETTVRVHLFLAKKKLEALLDHPALSKGEE